MIKGLFCCDGFRKKNRGFTANLRAGELYNQMRWLGSRVKDTLLPKNAFRFEKLKTVGQQLGLI